MQPVFSLSKRSIDQLETDIIHTDKRELCLRILRYNPQDPDSTPRFQDYQLEQAHGMTLFIALNEIRELQDPGLHFDFVCRAGICGSCGMLINGKPGLACRTLTEDLPALITLAPLPVFELIADLSVNTGKWMRAMSERLETWIHSEEVTLRLGDLEQRMEPALARELYELDRCIECGCCIAACGTAHMHAGFVGAMGLNKISRFQLDPRDDRSDEDLYQLVGDETGVFGCKTLLGCEDSCPKNLSLATQIAWLRRRMVSVALR